MSKPTDVSQFLEELGAGVLSEQMSSMITRVCGAVMAHEKAGEITLKLKFKPASDSTTHVKIDHDLSFVRPKGNGGKVSENEPQSSIMYVNEGNNPTQFPENQADMFRENGVPTNAD